LRSRPVKDNERSYAGTRALDELNAAVIFSGLRAREGHAAKELAKSMVCRIFDGDMLRENIAVARRSSKGQAVDGMRAARAGLHRLKMVAARIEQPDCAHGFVFDVSITGRKPSGSANCSKLNVTAAGVVHFVIILRC